MTWSQEKLDKIKERNENIVADYIKGLSTAEAGEKYGITGHQAHVIVKRAGVSRTLEEAWAVERARNKTRKHLERGVCSLADCDRPLEGQGYCQLHYNRFKKHGDPLKGALQNAGMTQTAEYRTWIGIRRRTRNTSHKDYPKYGGRGIGISDELYDNYQLFLNELGPKPSPKHSVDRIDTFRGYEVGNIRWATIHQQANNRRDNGIVPGVTKRKDHGVKCWHAKLTIDKVRVLSQYFEDYDDAVKARKEAEEKYGIFSNNRNA